MASLTLSDRLTDRETRTTRTVCSSFDRETRKDKSFTAVVLGSAHARRTRPRGSHSRASVASLALGDKLTDRETWKDKSFTAVVLGSAQARRTRPGREQRSL